MMCVDIVIYGLLLFLCELIESSPALRQMFHKAPSVAPSAYTADDDVERERAEAIDTSPEDVTVNVKGVRQVYATMEGCKRTYNAAVEDVYFNVHRKECFALLGVNGAGKTSTFRILTGEYSPTSGQAYIGGFNVLSQLRDARKLIGYCPQFDALTEQMTGFEHLDLYCIIKGIPEERRAELIDFTLRELDLEQYRNVRAGTYSGGNKRKLSVAIALLGNPSVLFLDEPSAGMDPEARKKMWKVIGNLKRRDGSVILTTHSMEEVEALCDRLTIMVAGRLRCLGTPTQIKGKFGSGYEVEVKIATPTKEEITARLQALGYHSPPNERVSFTNLREVLVSLRAEFLYDQVCETGAGAAIYKQLQTEKFVSDAVVITWAFIEESGWAVYNMLRASFIQVTPIEHYLSFYKFKVEKQPDKSLGYLFSVLETNKESLRILEYSVRQTSLEQIFNMFARQAEVSAMAALMTGGPQ